MKENVYADKTSGGNAALRLAVALLLAISLLPAAPLAAMADDDSEATSDDAVSVYSVGANSGSSDITVNGQVASSIIGALNTARYQGSAGNPAVVIVPKGTYTISAALKVYSNTTLIFEDGATIKLDGDPPSMVVGLTDSDIKGYNGASNITIKGGTWDAAGSTNCEVFQLRHGTNINISDAVMKNFRAHAINVAASKDVTIKNVTFQNALKPSRGDTKNLECIHTDIDVPGAESGANDGTPAANITISGCTFDNVYAGVGRHMNVASGVKYVTNLTIENCTFNKVSERAINLANVTNATIRNNKVTGTTPEYFLEVRRCNDVKMTGHSTIAPILIQECNGVTVDGGYIWNAPRQGISIGDSRVTIKNMHIVASRKEGIGIWTSWNSTISGNSIFNTKERGINISGVSNTTITGNRVQDCPDYGFLIHNKSKGIKLTNNVSVSKYNTSSMHEFFVDNSCTNVTQSGNKAGPRHIGVRTDSVNSKNIAKYSYRQLAIDVPSRKWKRLWGNSAFDTMSTIVKAGWTQTGGTVIIATADNFPDALSASGAAGQLNAPILLVHKHSLPGQTRNELARLKPARVIIAGGTGAITSNVEKAIQSTTGVKPERRWGQEAPDTAAALNEAVFGTKSSVAIVATSRSFYDALSAAPLSYAKGYPIFLTDGLNTISNATVASMKRCGIKQVIVVGGAKGAVSDKVVSKLRNNGITMMKRLWGQTHYDTSRAIANWGIGHGMNANKIGVATSYDYVDALCGAALCGKNNAVLVLADDVNGSNVDSGNVSVVKANKSAIKTGYVFGGRNAVGIPTFNIINNTTGM